MSKIRLLVTIFSAVTMVLGASTVFGQKFPYKPIRIVTATPGGGNDQAARIIAQGISGPLGQPVIVENRGSFPARRAVAGADPDGYTLYVGGNALWTGPLWQRPEERYNPLSEFAPITEVATRPFILVVQSSLGVKSVGELIAMAKARPGKINIARTTLGTDGHLAAELLKAEAKIDMLVVPYGGAGPAFNGLLSDQVQVLFAGLGPARPHIQSGKIRALATTGLQQSKLSPELPTVAETVPGFEIRGLTGIYAPLHTPAAVINRLNREIVRYINSPEGVALFTKKGDDIVGGTPKELVATIKTQTAKYRKLMADIRANLPKDQPK